METECFQGDCFMPTAYLLILFSAFCILYAHEYLVPRCPTLDYFVSWFSCIFKPHSLSSPLSTLPS